MNCKASSASPSSSTKSISVTSESSESLQLFGTTGADPLVRFVPASLTEEPSAF